MDELRDADEPYDEMVDANDQVSEGLSFKREKRIASIRPGAQEAIASRNASAASPTSSASIPLT